MRQAITRSQGLSTEPQSHNRMLIEFGLLLLIVLIAPRVDAQQQAGYVSEIHGKWLLNRSWPLSLGQVLPSGGVISNPSPSDADHIAITDLHGDLIERRNCKVPGNCSSPIRLVRPPSKGPSDYVSALFGGVMSLFGVAPNKYIVPRQRGDKLSEAVVRLEGNQLDLNPIFKGWEKTRYYLRFRLLSGQGSAPGIQAPEPLVFDWDPSKPSAVSTVGLKRGLYELALLRPRAAHYSGTGVSTWIFVSGPSEFANANEAFQEMLALTTKWGEDVTRESKDGFLRATLAYLSSQTPK